MDCKGHCTITDSPCDVLATHEQTKRYAKDLQSALGNLRQAKREIEEAYLDTMRRLAMAVEYRDNETGAHVMRLGRLCGFLAGKLGCSAEFVARISQASPMHDVGKIGIPDAILLKPGKLTAEEFEHMKRHTVIGDKLLDNGVSQIMRTARTIALTHHERFNGRGYPNGLAGREIPLEGRITALVDVFDALCSKRPYKEAFPLEQVVPMIQQERGQHFDPQLVDLFLEHLDEIVAIRDQVNAMGPCSFSQSISSEVPLPGLAQALRKRPL